MKVIVTLIGLLILLSLCGGCVIINITEGPQHNPQISPSGVRTTSSPQMYGNLLSNGGFENPVAHYPFTTMTGDQLTGWSIDSGSIDLMHGGWLPHSGAQSINLSGISPAMISQTIDTIPGCMYVLTFWVAGNPDKQEVKTLGVYWDGNELSPAITFNSTGHSTNDMGWRLVTISHLKASKSSTEIAFIDLQPSNDPYGVTLDDISVVPVQSIPVPEFPF